MTHSLARKRKAAGLATDVQPFSTQGYFLGTPHGFFCVAAGAVAGAVVAAAGVNFSDTELMQ